MTTLELLNLLKAVMPNSRAPSEWANVLLISMDEFGLTADLDRVAAFLAQIAVESQELNDIEENLSYSAERLVAVWPKRFPTVEYASQYARNPQKLANYVYSNRLGNGNEASGDGWMYRGRGLIQLTGRHNYAQAAIDLGLPLVRNPNVLLEKWAASRSACHFWFKRGFSQLADDLPDDNDEADFWTISQRVNGGAHGRAARRAYWLKARKHLGLPT